MTLAVGALFFVGDSAGWVDFATGNEPDDQWIYLSVFLVLGAVVMWRLVRLQARFDDDAKRRKTIAELDGYFESIRETLTIYRNRQERADWLATQNLTVDFMNDQLAKRDQEANDAVSKIVHLMEDAAQYINSNPLTGPASRADFDLATHRGETMVFEDRAKAAMEALRQTMRDLRRDGCQ